jgi:hypothetical protein
MAAVPDIIAAEDSAASTATIGIAKSNCFPGSLSGLLERRNISQPG